MFEDYSKERILRHFEVDPTIGLTEEEVQKRRSQYGENRLEEKKKDSLIKTFFSNFKDPMTFILLGASVLSLILAVLNIAQGKVEPGQEWLEFMDVAIIFAVVLINAVIGTVQEKKAEKALEALKKMSSPRASVRRGGRILSVDAKDLVPGDIVILEEEFKEVADHFIMMTDDGSYGRHGLVTQPLQELLEAGEQFDEVLAIGPVPMMKFVCKTTEPFGVHTSVSLNPIMIDGTGMCGGCRVTVGGETKFACVDGPEFDGHKVDYAELMSRNGIYREREAEVAKDHVCRMEAMGKALIK